MTYYCIKSRVNTINSTIIRLCDPIIIVIVAIIIWIHASSLLQLRLLWLINFIVSPPSSPASFLFIESFLHHVISHVYPSQSDEFLVGLFSQIVSQIGI